MMVPKALLIFLRADLPAEFFRSIPMIDACVMVEEKSSNETHGGRGRTRITTDEISRCLLDIPVKLCWSVTVTRRRHQSHALDWQKLVR